MSFEQQIKKLAQVIINYSTAVKPGDLVLLRSTSPAGAPLSSALYEEALRAGGSAFVYNHIHAERSLGAAATDNLDLLAAVNPMLKLMYETADVIVRIDADENLQELAALPMDKQRACAKAKSDLIDIQMVREGNGSLRRCSTQFPTAGYAESAGMDADAYMDFFLKGCKAQLDDPVSAWIEQGNWQQKLAEYMKGKKHIYIRGKDVDLHMSIEDRTFLSDDGKRNMPGGEIFTGPVESSLEGWIRYSYPAIYQGNGVEGAELTFEQGKVVKATAKKNESYLVSVLDTDAGSRYVGELGIGTNFEIQQFTGSILFDEKIGGTVHLAVGKGYPETGSHNHSSVHWDMICDLRDGEILVDDEVFYREGQFLVD